MRFTTPNAERWSWFYYTRDGDCSRYPEADDPANPVDAVSSPECGRPIARAGEDYVSVQGEWTFDEPGSRSIRIPIIDDDLDETDGEAFSINVTNQNITAGTTTYYNAYIRITDDDPKSGADPSDGSDAPPAPAVVTTVARVDQRPTDQRTNGTASPPASAPAPGQPAPTTTATAPRDLEVTLPSGELEPGVGFELVIERHPEPEAERDGGRGGSGSWMPLGVGAIALGSGGVVWLRRQRRWSPTRS